MSIRVGTQFYMEMSERQTKVRLLPKRITLYNVYVKRLEAYN